MYSGVKVCSLHSFNAQNSITNTGIADQVVVHYVEADGRTSEKMKIKQMLIRFLLLVILAKAYLFLSCERLPVSYFKRHL